MGRISWHGGSTKRDECKDSLAEHIGNQLLKQRQKHQMSMRELAERSGLSLSFLCDLENGWRVAGAKTLLKLSKVFGVPFGYWVKGYSE